jgi:protein phosphatase methylesterase 1
MAGDPNVLSPIFLCLHGAGHSAMAFAVLAAEVKQYATLASFDFRGHGQSKIVSDDLSAATLIADIEEILKYLIAEYPT